MSLNVMVIPEDSRKDQYALKPIIKAMFDFIGKPKAKITVCADPILGGTGQALKVHRIKEIIDMNRGYDLFILCVDRDGEENRRLALDNMEEVIAQDAEINRDFVAENAWQEIEAWILVGLKSRIKGWTIKEIRKEIHPKENIFEPYAKEKGLTFSPGGGRQELGELAAENYALLRNRCKEDILNLETKIKALVR